MVQKIHFVQVVNLFHVHKTPSLERIYVESDLFDKIISDQRNLVFATLEIARRLPENRLEHCLLKILGVWELQNCP